MRNKMHLKINTAGQLEKKDTQFSEIILKWLAPNTLLGPCFGVLADGLIILLHSIFFKKLRNMHISMIVVKY